MDDDEIKEKIKVEKKEIRDIDEEDKYGWE
jgi:predicted polyphosphate/ATP-dependent NAD kinase